MKQIWPTYAYSPTTNVLTLTGLNIDRDQLLLVTAADRGRIMYNFADSSVTASAFTSGANTALTLVATTAGLTTTAALVIYYDDQLAGTSVTVSSLPAISGTVTANLAGSFNEAIETVGDVSNASQAVAVHLYDDGGTFMGNLNNPFYVSGTVTIGSALPAGTNRIGVVTIGGGTVTIGAGTAQIGSVTASISGTVPISISSVTVGNSVTIGSLPAISGTVTISNISSLPDAGENPVIRTFAFGYDYDNEVPVAIASVENALKISGTVAIGNSVTIGSLPALVAGTAQVGSVTANTFAVQGTAVTTSNFTSTTASTVLANFNATREVLTIFNEGAGNLHVCAGATCTTIAYQVRLSAGDYYEVPNHQTSLTHSAVFATAGTARVCQVS